MSAELSENDVAVPECDCEGAPGTVHVAPAMHDSIGAIALAVGFAFLLVAFMRLLDRYQTLLATLEPPSVES